MNHFTFMCVRKETSEGFFKVKLLIFNFTELTFYSYFNLKATGGVAGPGVELGLSGGSWWAVGGVGDRGGGYCSWPGM